MNMLLDSTIISNIRFQAILSCYGEDAIIKDRIFTLLSGEVIYSWAIEGVSLPELKEQYTDAEIEYMYYNLL